MNRKRGAGAIPAVICEYNHNINGCDKMDQMAFKQDHFQRNKSGGNVFFTLAFKNYSSQFLHYI